MTEIPTKGHTHRGGHLLPREARELQRDITGEQIAGAAGTVATGYRLDRAEYAENTATYGGMGYAYLIYSPGTEAQNWIAFREEAELRAWGTAYGLDVPAYPAPGERFEIHLPTHSRDWQPLLTCITAIEDPTAEDIDRQAAAAEAIWHQIAADFDAAYGELDKLVKQMHWLRAMGEPEARMDEVAQKFTASRDALRHLGGAVTLRGNPL